MEATTADSEIKIEQEPDRPHGYAKVPIESIRPAARNARKGSVARVIASLQEFGQHRPVVVQKSTGEVIVGNHLYKAAMTLGWTEIDALFVDDDDKQALRRAIADNAVGDYAQWDKEELADMLEEVGEVPGFSDREIDKLRRELDQKEGGKDADDVVFPITPRFSEHYDYIVIVATNDTDAAYLETRFDLRREANYQDQKVGKSKVITVDRLREMESR